MGNNVTKTSAYNSKGRGRPRLYSSNAAKQAAYRDRKQPPTIEPGSRVHHRTYGSGIVTHRHGSNFTVAFFDSKERIWRDLPAAELVFSGRVRKLPRWTDPGKPLSKNYKPPRKWKVALPPTHLEVALDGEKVAVPVYAVRKAGKRKIKRDYTKFINHNIAVLLERAMR